MNQQSWITHASLGLYIHIPFCTSRCRYCNFYFETGWSPRVLERTLQGVVEEARWYVHQGFLAKGSITTVYLGGGTPSVVPPETMNRFLGELLSILGPSLAPVLDEFCVEANPESIGAELLEVLSHHRVDRISLGIQSFQTNLLHLLGRRATKAITLRSLDLIKTHWSGELNTDFITGIPSQTQAQVQEDLHQVLQWNPDHVSLYSLMVEDKTPFKQLVDIPPPQGGVELLPHGVYEDLWFAGRDVLESAGFTQYEVSNFAQPGKESAHNLGYWQLKPYLGLGPGAYSTLWTEAGPLRTINPTVFAYSPPSKPWNSFTRTEEKPGPREWLSELLLTAVRTDRGITKERILEDLTFGPQDSGGSGSAIGSWSAAGFESQPVSGSGSVSGSVSGINKAATLVSNQPANPWELVDQAIGRVNDQARGSQVSPDPGPWVQPKADSWTLSREARYIQDRLLVDLELMVDQLTASLPWGLEWAKKDSLPKV